MAAPAEDDGNTTARQAKKQGSADDPSNVPRRNARPRPACTTATTAILAFATLLAGCGPLQRLTLNDKNSNEAALLVSVRPAAWARNGAAGPGRGFEAGYQQYRAAGDDVLAAGDLQVGSQLLTGRRAGAEGEGGSPGIGFTDRFYFGPAFELDVGVGMKLDVDYELRPRSGVTGAQPFARARARCPTAPSPRATASGRTWRSKRAWPLPPMQAQRRTTARTWRWC
ncbi:MAG: hypothetical protein U1F67_08910 [Rubrivivax sp.]